MCTYVPVKLKKHSTCTSSVDFRPEVLSTLFKFSWFLRYATKESMRWPYLDLVHLITLRWFSDCQIFARSENAGLKLPPFSTCLREEESFLPRVLNLPTS